MDSKILEVKSVGGTAYVLAVKLASDNVAERRILEKQGFASDRGHVLVATLKPRPIDATYDAHDWHTGEGVQGDWPMLWVHKQIETRWDELDSGEVIDVTDAPNPNLPDG